MDNNNFWTDELVAEYALGNQRMSLCDFKRSKQPSSVIDLIKNQELEIAVLREKISELNQCLLKSIMPLPYIPGPPIRSKRYTEKELLSEEEKAFNAARELHQAKTYKFNCFSDYKNYPKGIRVGMVIESGSNNRVVTKIDNHVWFDFKTAEAIGWVTDKIESGEYKIIK